MRHRFASGMTAILIGGLVLAPTAAMAAPAPSEPVASQSAIQGEDENFFIRDVTSDTFLLVGWVKTHSPAWDDLDWNKAALFVNGEHVESTWVRDDGQFKLFREGRFTIGDHVTIALIDGNNPQELLYQIDLSVME